ncbi:hypothetical protein [Streptomyces sp. SID5910]|nr:hypothetical protein [Streptomyces sp. SID5910]MYR43104.1 hypothetical protein [Streptomyces sp. SID5910]
MTEREKFEANVEAEVITCVETEDVEDFMLSFRCMLTTFLTTTEEN